MTARSAPERLASLETLTDHFSDSIDRLKDQISELDDSVHGLESSQALQLAQLKMLLDSVQKLQATTNQLSGQLANRILEKELQVAAKSIDLDRLKKLAGMGAGIVAFIWGAYAGVTQLVKPNDDLLKRAGHDTATH